MKRQKLNKGDIAWYMPGGKRPFAYSTKATSDLIVVLYELYGDLQRVYEEIHYDVEAKSIVARYLKEGYNQINIG